MKFKNLLLVLVAGVIGLSLVGFGKPEKSTSAASDNAGRRFVSLRETQLQEKCREQNIAIPSEYLAVLQATASNNWPAASNAFALIKNNIKGHRSGLLWHDTLEIYGVFEQFANWTPSLIEMYGQDILRVISSNGIFFGGTDPGRFVITAFQETTRQPFYVVTQNALADNSYMDYLRDRVGTSIWIPSQLDSNRAFQEYVQAIKSGKIDPGADVKMDGGRVQVQGVGGVMQINGILAKMIFESNKTNHEFYVEESYVIPWMYPYLTPHGLIMKINREPTEITPEVVKTDHDFWDLYVNRLMNDKNFINDVVARKTFSKLRSAIAGLYAARGNLAEAEYAFKQSVELYPLSPEAVFRLADLYMRQRRFEDAKKVVAAFVAQDVHNDSAQRFLKQIEESQQMMHRRTELETLLRSGQGADINVSFELLQIYNALQEQGAMNQLFADILRSNLPPESHLQLAQMLIQMRRFDLVEPVFVKYLEAKPDDLRIQVELAAVRVELKRIDQAIATLKGAVEKGGEPILAVLRKDQRFQPLWNDVQSLGPAACQKGLTLAPQNYGDGVETKASDPVTAKLPAPSVAGQDGEYIFTTYNGTITITKYTGNSINVLIPSEINGLPVVCIGTNAFAKNTRLINVTIPDSVSVIGNMAFSGCSQLASVMIPDSVTSIGDHAFFSCRSLNSITIPDGVTSIGNNAIQHCTSLTNITIGKSVALIGSYAFDNGPNLTSITVDAANASYSSANGILFNKSRTEIIKYPDGKPEKSYTIPASVTTIRRASAFQYCRNLTSILVEDSNTTFSSLDGVLFNKKQTTIVRCPGGSTGNYSIPNSVINIEHNAFYGCSNLTGVIIPGSVTKMGDWVFRECRNLTGITLPDDVPSLGFGAFYDCRSLTNVTIPASIHNLENWTFWDCSSLINITIPGSVTNFVDNTFGQCSSLLGVYFQGNAPSVGSSIFRGAKAATVYRTADATGWPPVPTAWAGRPTALWDSDGDGISDPTVLATNLWAQAPEGIGAGSAARYIDNNDGTVTDTVTGLMWTKNANHGVMAWSNAVAYCDNLVTNGYSDWRMPTVALGGKAELDTLFRADGKLSGARQESKETPFAGVQSNYYWSGTSFAYDTDRAWLVNMGDGYVSDANKTYSFYVWPVRGGQKTPNLKSVQ